MNPRSEQSAPDRGIEARLNAVDESLQRIEAAIEHLERQGQTTRRSVNDIRQELRKVIRGPLDGIDVNVEKIMKRQSRLMVRLIPATATISDLELGVKSILRRIAVDVDELDFPFRLRAKRFQISSQREEDGLLLATLKECGVKSKRFIELGCGTNGGNSGFLAAELGWSGLMVDADPEAIATAETRLRSPSVDVVQHWITREGIEGLLREFDLVDGEIDVLGIDIDGNDIWVWETLSAIAPRVVVIEYNTAFGADRSVAVPYTEGFRRDKTICRGLYYGASLRALVHIGRRKGYRLVATENVNAFFIREDLAKTVPEADPEAVFRLYEKDRNRLDAIGQDLFAVFEQEGLELVVIE